MTNWLAIGIFVGALIFGIGFGILSYRFWILKSDKKIMKNLLEVLDGKRKNEIEIDGEIYDAYKFKLRDKDGNETLIDLKGGDVEQDGKEESIKESNNIEGFVPELEEDSRSPRKRKRNNGERLGRFGRRF